MGSVRLFVYGSLKRGERHHQELAGALFLGETETVPGYRLELLGEYLALVSVNPRTASEPAPAPSVKGELFELDESRLPALDAFEGEDYVRGEVFLVPAPGRAPTPSPVDHVVDHGAAGGAKPSENLGIALAYFMKAR